MPIADWSWQRHILHDLILNFDQSCLLCIMAHELCVRKTQWVLCKNMKSLPGVRRLASHTSLKVPSLSSSLESVGHGGTGEIVLTRLSLKTSWLLAYSALQKGKEGFRSPSPSWKGSVFLKGSYRKTADDRSTTEVKALGLGWVGPEMFLGERRLSRCWLLCVLLLLLLHLAWGGRQGRGCSRRLGYIWGGNKVLVF